MKHAKTTLAIANVYGNVDVRNSLSKAYVHIRGHRLQPLCRKLGIKFAQALIDFGGKKRYGFQPVYDAVVVSAKSAPKLLAAIKERDERANNPAALARKEKARQARLGQERARRERCDNIGIDPDGQTAKWLAQGEIDADLAELIGWKAAYRHEYTDYDERLNSKEFYNLRSCGFSPQEARDELRETARNLATEKPIPATWPEYLETYGFDSPIAKALASIFKEPERCHPIWFKEAQIAVRRLSLPLDGLTYEIVTEAIDQWRCERS